jgi:hypothetical protein
MERDLTTERLLSIGIDCFERGEIGAAFVDGYRAIDFSK